MTARARRCACCGRLVAGETIAHVNHEQGWLLAEATVTAITRGGEDCTVPIGQEFFPDSIHYFLRCRLRRQLTALSLQYVLEPLKRPICLEVHATRYLSLPDVRHKIFSLCVTEALANVRKRKD